LKAVLAEAVAIAEGAVDGSREDVENGCGGQAD
jgi:hypothetical protein